MGFGIATRLSRGGIRAAADVATGTLAYMAPEQTGRIDRRIDARTDLYALGVTLYELATGALPFSASDAGGWIHAHLALSPAPIDTVPAAVSAIILKLLAKNPDERYQTAAGLEADLRRCLFEWEAHGVLDRFPLGEYDVLDRLLIRKRLYGREGAVEELRAAVEGVVTRGAAEVVLLTGSAGIGKTAIGIQLQAMAASRALFAAGKSDQYRRDVPYATIAQALQQLARQVLGKSDAVVERWREALRAALGENGRLAVDLVPDLERVIGAQPPVAELPPPDARARFKTVFGRLLGVFARPEHPVALFLDDLQWADPATVELLGDLLSSQQLRDILVVGAFRDSEIGAGSPLLAAIDGIRKAGVTVHDLELPPLLVDDVVRLVADALRCDAARARPLAEVVHAKTAGNPLFAIQFLRSLADDRLLAFDRAAGSWSWDLGRIGARRVTSL